MTWADLAVASVRDNFMILMPHLRKCLEEKHVPLLDNHAKVTTLTEDLSTRRDQKRIYISKEKTNSTILMTKLLRGW